MKPNNRNERRQERQRQLGKLKAASESRRGAFIASLRTYFLTGLVVAAPISITAYITWWFVDLFDAWFKPMVPAVYNPDTYLPFTVPGVGLVFALICITLLGALTANLFGRTLVGYGERLLNRMPLVRNIYRALKQIFETALSQSESSFQEVGLIEYPRKGLYALVFISVEATGEVLEHTGGGDAVLSVFLPTTPNPTSGFLLFVPEKDVTVLDMTVEEGAKLVISAGLVSPAYDPQSTMKVPSLSKETANGLPRKGAGGKGSAGEKQHA